MPIANSLSPAKLETSASKKELSPSSIMQIGFAFWGSKTLLSAVDLGIFTELARQPQDLLSLQKRLELHSRGARDFLDALVALGFLSRENGVYANAPEANLFLDKAKPSYIGGILELANNRIYPSWNNLTKAIRTGLPQNMEESGLDESFLELYDNAGKSKEFLRAMSGISRPANMAIAKKLPWAQYKTFVDLGTAQGDLAVQIALANPHVTGIGFDLPPVRPVFEEYVKENDLADRLKYVEGSFFEEPLPKADVLLFGHILHNWNLDEKKTLLKKAYEALPPGGAVVVYEPIIDDERSKNVFGLTMSLNMLIETSGGFDFTGADCKGWMEEAGFKKVRVEHLGGPDSMVIGIK